MKVRNHVAMGFLCGAVFVGGLWGGNAWKAHHRAEEREKVAKMKALLDEFAEGIGGEDVKEENYTREALKAMARRLQEATSEPLVEIKAAAVLYALEQVPADLSHEEAYRRILGRMLKEAVDKLPGGMRGAEPSRRPQ